MNMSKLPEDGDNSGVVNNQESNAANTPEELRVMQMMSKMQKDAETNAGNADFNSAVNSPKTLHQHSTTDNANYWEITGLPTGCKLYPANTMVEARPLKVIEVKKLASINDKNADYVINDVIRRCVRVSGGLSDVGELFLADKLFIIFWLRGVTYRDSSYTIDFSCPKCKQNSKYHFEINNLEVNYLKDEYDQNTVIDLASGDAITLRYLKIKDEFEIERFIEINQRLLGEIDKELLGLACMITSINGNSMPSLAEKYNLVLGFSAGDLSYITTYINEFTIGIEPTMNVDCKECGGTVPMGVTFRADFFLPKCTLR